MNGLIIGAIIVFCGAAGYVCASLDSINDSLRIIAENTTQRGQP